MDSIRDALNQTLDRLYVEENAVQTNILKIVNDLVLERDTLKKSEEHYVKLMNESK